MASRLKGNKGYFTLLAGETLYSSIQLGLSLALINLPVAVIAGLLDFGANVVSGLLMGPQKAALPAEVPTIFNKNDPPLTIAKNFFKKVYTYNKSCFLDPEYTVGASATGAGMTFFFQGALGIKSLLASHSISIITGFLTVTGVSLPLGLGICGAMIGLGLLAIMNGNMEKWKGISKYYHKVFKEAAPPEVSQKNFLQKAFDRPLINKIFNNPVAKALKKALLVGMTVEASLFAITNYASVILMRSAALLSAPQKIIASAAPIGWAGVCCWRSTWQMISAGRLALRNVFGKVFKKSPAKTSKTAAAPAPQPAPALQPVAAVATAALTDTFGNAVTAPSQNSPLAMPHLMRHPQGRPSVS